MDYRVRIQVSSNGFMIEYDDPDIQKRNRESESKWQDPSRNVVATTPQKATRVLSKLLPLLQEKIDDPQPTDFETALAEAMGQADAK